jgi:polyhydroxyalkanoate synthesis regulator phasin
MAKSNDCIKAIQASVKRGKISDTEAKAIIADITRRAKERAEKKAISLDNALKEIAGEIQASEGIMAKIDQRNKLLELQTRRMMKDAAKGFEVWGKGFTANIFGSERTSNKGSGYGADQQFAALYGRYATRFISELESAGVWKDFSKGRFAKEFYIESYQLDTPNGKPGITGNKAATAVARIYRDIRSELTAHLNRRGAYIVETPGWIITQTHSQERLQAVGDGDMGKSYKAWKEFVLPLLDRERSFDGVDPEIWMRNVHNNIYTGHHLVESDAFEPSRLKAHGSLASRISSARVLWFKGPEEAFKYNEAFGVRDYNHAIMQDIRRSTRNAVLMERFGPNSKANMLRALDELRAEAKKRPDSAKQLAALNEKEFISKYEVLAGETEISSRPKLSKFLDTVKAWKIASVGGKMLFSSFGDKVFMQSEMAYQGVAALDSAGKQLESVVRGRKDAQALMLELGIVPHSLAGNVAARWGFETRTNFKTQDYLHKFFSLNFMNWWTDANKATMADVTASNVANSAHLPMESLPEKLGRILQHYGITGKEWDAIRSTKYAMDEEPLDGFSFITTDQFDNISDDALDGIAEERGWVATGSNRKRVRDSLKDKYGAVIVDRVNHGVPEPGAKERYVTTFGGSQRGTFVGEASSLLMVFKTFPVTVASKILGRDIYGTGAKSFAEGAKQGAFRIAGLIAAAGVAGYIGNAMRDLTAGRTPKRLIEDGGKVNWDVWIASMQRGGGLGIYGDFLLSEYDRSYRTALGALAGPVGGQIDPLAALGSKAVGLATGKDGVRAESLAYDAEKFIEGNIPFSSLFYVKPVLDYFVFWNLKEMVSPGVLRRSERSVRDKSHQDFWITPSEDRFPLETITK